jgi:hypothetical protein
MTRQDILARVQRGELQAEEALSMLEKLDKLQPPAGRKLHPPVFKVATKSGWCSVYFDGLRRPCTLPAQLWLELLEEENIRRFKQFLEENKGQFKNKG